MNLADLPLVAQVFESGARDPVFDALLLAGAPVIVLLALLGRSSLTVAIATAYVAIFFVHVLTNALD